jgi:hypothetical protein
MFHQVFLPDCESGGYSVKIKTPAQADRGFLFAVRGEVFFDVFRAITNRAIHSDVFRATPHPAVPSYAVECLINNFRVLPLLQEPQFPQES